MMKVLLQLKCTQTVFNRFSVYFFLFPVVIDYTPPPPLSPPIGITSAESQYSYINSDGPNVAVITY